MKKKIIAITLAVVVLATAIVAGTLAWLQDTKTITNTFTIGNVKIALWETDNRNPLETTDEGNEYKLIPGETYDKDPKVTVKAGSEECYLFVKIVAEDYTDAIDVIQWAPATGWTALDAVNQPGVYYYKYTPADKSEQDYISADKMDVEIAILANNRVTINSALTAEQIAALDENRPTLTITAYAIQKANLKAGETPVTTPAGAWAIVSPAP